MYKIQSGNVIERYKAWKSGTPGKKRGGRMKGSSTMKKVEQNRQGAVRRLARVLNANFTHRDFLLTMKYDNEHLPADWEGHERDRALVLERIKKRLKKLGLPAARCVSLCANRDGKTGREVRRHVHAVISGDAIRFDGGVWRLGEVPLDNVWGKGSVEVAQLWDQDDYTGLAVYLLRQARTDKADWKQYHTSRNMVRPVAEEETALTGRELRAPKGAKVLENHYDARSGSGYIRYVKTGRRKAAEAGEADCHGASRLAMTGKSGHPGNDGKQPGGKGGEK